MKKNLRRAGYVSLTVGALGCGEPSAPDPVRADDLFAKDAIGTDSLAGEAWRKYLDPAELHRAWAPPTDSPWRPYYKPTLIAAIATVQSAAKPIRSQAMPASELAAANFITRTEIRNTAFFIDLSGEESVLWAATLRPYGVRPVLTINNWPHQAGLLALERPLGALLYFAEAASKTPVPPEAPPAFILERSRLGQKGLDPIWSQFDNRYFHAQTDFPSAAVLQSRNISRIVYINPRGITAGCEEDDLNEYFAGLSNAGLQFTYVKPGLGPLDPFETGLVTPADRQTIFTKPAIDQYVSQPDYHHHYYHPYYHYSTWHTSYWSRSSGAWGGSDWSSSGGSSGFSS
jgi:hypothetical protein